jgi:hypothetical protein
MSNSIRWPVAGPLAVIAILLAFAGPVAAQNGRLETVAVFHLGEEHLDLQVFRAANGIKLGMISIENPLRMRGLPTGSLTIQPSQWPAVIELWTKARAGITGAEPYVSIGDVDELYNLTPARLNLSTGPTVRFAVQGQSAASGINFELQPGDLNAMGAALEREQKLLDGPDPPRSRPRR